MLTDITIVQQPSQDTIDAAAEHIRQLDRTYYQRYGLEVGKYLFETFYNSDPAAVKSHDPRKQASLRSLAAHPVLAETGLSLSTLANFLGVHVQLRLVRPELAAVVEELSLSKQIALLTVSGEEAKAQLAHSAREPGVSVRDLKAKILAARETDRGTTGKHKPGPKAALATVRHLRAAERALVDALGTADDGQEISDVLAAVRKLLGVPTIAAVSRPRSRLKAAQAVN